MIESIRNVEKAVGKVSYEIGTKEWSNRVFKRSIYVVKDIKKWDIFTAKNIRIIRPWFGMAPKFYEEILGKSASVDIERGTALISNFIM